MEMINDYKPDAGIAYENVSNAPTILLEENFDSEKDFKEQLNQLKERSNNICDLFESMLLELFYIRNPGATKESNESLNHFVSFRAEYLNGADSDLTGSWVLYDNGVMMHLLRPTDQYELRTSCNTGLISNTQQDILSKSNVAIAGLNTGGLCASTLASEGVTSFFLGGVEHTSAYNTHGMSPTIGGLLKNKLQIISRQIWEIDPFISINQGMSQDSDKWISEMFSKDKMPDVVIDTLDDLASKTELRKACCVNNVPLVWAVNSGDGLVQIGVERFDKSSKDIEKYLTTPSISNKNIQSGSNLELSFEKFDNDRLPSRMASSIIMACNNKRAGIPQMAGTLSIAAGAISQVVRNILFKKNIVKSFFVDIESELDPNFKANRLQDKVKTMKILYNHDLLAEEI